jgi:hypothetical protein
MPAVKPTTDSSLVAPLAAGLDRRGMATPALLYLAAHRPLAFAAGNLLAVAAPLAAALGVGQVQSWAQLLLSPEAVETLTAALGDSQP